MLIEKIYSIFYILLQSTTIYNITIIRVYEQTQIIVTEVVVLVTTYTGLFGKKKEKLQFIVLIDPTESFS